MRKARIDLDIAFSKIKNENTSWKKISSNGLDLDYAIILERTVADELFTQLQESVEYLDAELTKVKVFGKWHQIPRQQNAYGDPGLKYHFSGVTVPAKPWIPALEAAKKLLKELTGFDFNFVLVNRYRNGLDHIGEHKDDEAELDGNTPIASLSLGQHRDFVLRHESLKKKVKGAEVIPPVKILLEHGSLLLMNPPTNKYWYHSLPQRKSAPGERINLTFRKIINSK